MKKVTAVIVGSVGYVLGARAGRQRYEQIRSLAMRVRSNPKLQQTARQAADRAKDVAPGGKEGAHSTTQAAGTPTSAAAPPSAPPVDDTAYPTTS